MIYIPNYTDTGWEMLSDLNIRGRIKNGMATVIFEGYKFNGQIGADTLMFTLPDRYRPTNVIFFCIFTNTKEPQACQCRIQSSGEIRVYPRSASSDVVGCVSYHVK